MKFLCALGIIFSLGFFSCKEKDRIVTGRLVYDCIIPVTNKKVIVKYTNKGTSGNFYYSETVSDANGYFLLSFKAKKKPLTLSFDGVEIEDVRSESFYDIGDINVNTGIDLIVKIKLLSTLTSNDTLIFNDLSNNYQFPSGYSTVIPEVRIPGPFTDLLNVDTLINATFSTFRSIHMSNPKYDFKYRLSGQEEKNTEFYSVKCGFSEVVLYL